MGYVLVKTKQHNTSHPPTLKRFWQSPVESRIEDLSDNIEQEQKHHSLASFSWTHNCQSLVCMGQHLAYSRKLYSCCSTMLLYLRLAFYFEALIVGVLPFKEILTNDELCGFLDWMEYHKNHIPCAGGQGRVQQSVSRNDCFQTICLLYWSHVLEHSHLYIY